MVAWVGAWVLALAFGADATNPKPPPPWLKVCVEAPALAADPETPPWLKVEVEAPALAAVII